MVYHSVDLVLFIYMLLTKQSTPIVINQFVYNENFYVGITTYVFQLMVLMKTVKFILDCHGNILVSDNLGICPKNLHTSQ